MSRTRIVQIQTWTFSNPVPCIFIGIVIIEIGLIIEFFYDRSPTFLSFSLAHGFIILGEVIAVTFFLHLFVEQKHYEESSRVLFELGEASKKILNQQSESTDQEFKRLIQDFKVEADSLVHEINKDLFAAILKDKLPHQIVKPILDSNFFNAEVLRKNFEITFKNFSINGNTWRILQRITFDLEYVFGNKPEYFYDMPISLVNTPFAEYKVRTVGFRKYGGSDEEWTSYTLGKGVKKVNEDFVLENPIKIHKAETIKVFQEIDLTCKIDNAGIVDNYYVNYHTIKMRINIENLPENYDFKIYPSFPSTKFKPPSITGTKISYKNIDFLVPGQGFGFSISEKNSLNN